MPGEMQRQLRRHRVPPALLVLVGVVACLAALFMTRCGSLALEGVSTPDSVAFVAARRAPPALGIRPADYASACRLPVPLQADPNQWGMIRPLEGKRPPRKPPYIASYLLNRVTRQNKEGVKETIQCWDRSSTIIPAMMGHTIAVHNGRDMTPIVVNEGMIGYKLWEFVPSHTFKSHPKQAKVTKYKGR